MQGITIWWWYFNSKLNTLCSLEEFMFFALKPGNFMSLIQLGHASSMSLTKTYHRENTWIAPTWFFYPKLAVQIGDVSKCWLIEQHFARTTSRLLQSPGFNSETQSPLFGFEVCAPCMLWSYLWLRTALKTLSDQHFFVCWNFMLWCLMTANIVHRMNREQGEQSCICIIMHSMRWWEWTGCSNITWSFFITRDGGKQQPKIRAVNPCINLWPCLQWFKRQTQIVYCSEGKFLLCT